MLFFLFAYFVGYYEIYMQSPLKATNRYLKGRLSLYHFHKEGRYAVGYCLAHRKRRLLSELSREGLSAECSPIRGLPQLFWRNRYRVGALLGILLGIVLTVLSGQFIWQIEVVGNETVSDEEVLSLLRDEGVYEGAYAEGIDALAVANRILAKSSSLAFLGVNIIGSRVEAVVLEHRDKGESVGEPIPSNIVATKNGVIVSVELESGTCKLKAGDVVTKGELLISGVNQLRNETYHYQSAKGHVYAETVGEISLTKPLYRYEKDYTGAVFAEKELIFFNKSKKLSKDCGNLPLTCDRIETRERVMLFERIPLPIWFVTVSYYEFSLTEQPLSVKEATRLAREEILATLSTTPLVSYRETLTVGEGFVTLTVTYRAIEDIAKEYPLFTLP